MALLFQTGQRGLSGVWEPVSRSHELRDCGSFRSLQHAENQTGLTGGLHWLRLDDRGAEVEAFTSAAGVSLRAISRHSLGAGLFSIVSVMVWYSLSEQHLAAPTTQSPAGGTGQGSGLTLGPRFSDYTNACGAGKVQWYVGDGKLLVPG